MSTQTPTPETDAHQNKMNQWEFDEELAFTYRLARKLERERDDARAALSGRTVSCSNCNETARQLEAMREAVKELRESLEVGKDSVGAWDWCNSALTKLQPLLKT